MDACFNKSGCGEIPQLPDCPTVEVRQGKLKGKTCMDRNKGIYYSFLSVPFAKPPLKQLRFMPPKPAGLWCGILDATKDLPTCIQQEGITKETIGQEDCLYLNIHTSKIPEENDLLRPVMFYIHSGMFVQGSGNTEFLGAEYLMTQEVVLVTANYRLGTLGFASCSDNSIGVYGNMGLKDQVMALQWTKDNIVAFGGNPNNVTIFGDASVGFHILSPMSKNLFHRAISMAGNALCAWCNGRKGTFDSTAEQLKIITNCKVEMLKRMQNLPVEDIVGSQEKHRIVAQIHELYDYGPVVETQITQEAFLPAAPIDMYKSGNYNHVPFMMGYKNLDGLFTEIFTKLNTGKSYLLTDMMYAIPNDLKLRPQDKLIAKNKIKKFYFGDEEPSVDNLEKYYDLATDVWFNIANGRVLKAQLDNNDRIYLYRFSADTNLNVFKRMIPNTEKYKGACFNDDLGYLFKTIYTPKFKPSSKEAEALNTIIPLYTNFAKYGKPTNMDSNVKWLPVTKLRWNYLEIDTTLKTGFFPDKERFQFWESIYRSYNNQTLSCSSCICGGPVIVEIKEGKLLGKISKDRYDQPFYSFLKLPYAKPPVGRRRFLAPLPVRAWCGVYNACTDDCPLPIQQRGPTKEIVGQEDCLYLNVHTPELPNDNALLRPVMFYIHGGGNVEGSGNSDYLGPDFLMPHGVVLVTVNYRLGILGFASSTNNTIKVPGNMGLKDQTMALKWVRDHIEYFGGDPNNITLFGDGSGAGNVHLHMLSPMSRCLFHKVFAMSGSALSPVNVGVKGTLEMKAKMLNIPIDDKAKMLKLLQELPVEDILGTFEQASLLIPINEPFEFGPVIETQKKYPAFLPASPTDLLKSGIYSHVPLIIGHAKLETLVKDLYTKAFTKKPTHFKDFKLTIPCDLNVSDDEKPAVAQKIKQYYYGNDALSVKNIDHYAHLGTDIWFDNGIRSAIRAHIANEDTVYYYNFIADTDLNYSKKVHQDAIDLIGACRVDDLGYIFKTIKTPKFEHGSVEDKAMNRIVSMWTNFAKYGKPTTFENDVAWIPVTPLKMNCFEIGSLGSTATQYPDSESFAFWEELYTKYGKVWNKVNKEI